MENATEDIVKRLAARYNYLFEGKTYEDSLVAVGLTEAKKDSSKSASAKSSSTSSSSSSSSSSSTEKPAKSKKSKNAMDMSSASSVPTATPSASSSTPPMNMMKNKKSKSKKSSKSSRSSAASSKSKKSKKVNEALNQPGGFETIVRCKHCKSEDLQLSEMRYMIRCKNPECGYTDLVENVPGIK